MIIDCPVHGAQPARGLVGGDGRVTFIGSSSSCPLCGRMAPIRDGTYDIVNSVVRAFHATGATRDQVARLHEIAKSVQAGSATAEDAEQQVAALGGVFLSVWRTLNTQGTAIQTVVAIIALFLMIYFEKQSDVDAAKLQAATEKQIVATQSVERVGHQILEELRKQSAASPAPQMKPSPMQLTQQASQPQRRVSAIQPNRQERRKAKALERRQPRS